MENSLPFLKDPKQNFMFYTTLFVFLDMLLLKNQVLSFECRKRKKENLIFLSFMH